MFSFRQVHCGYIYQTCLPNQIEVFNFLYQFYRKLFGIINKDNLRKCSTAITKFLLYFFFN